MESVSIVPASLAERIPLPDEALTARMLAKAREGFDRKIVVLDDGAVAGIGAHEELFRSCEAYREICLSQLSKEEVERDEQ